MAPARLTMAAMAARVISARSRPAKGVPSGRRAEPGCGGELGRQGCRLDEDRDV